MLVLNMWGFFALKVYGMSFVRWFKSKIIEDKGGHCKRKMKTAKARKKKLNQSLYITKVTLH